MNVFGVIIAVQPTHLMVSLPGRILGKVPVSNISESYMKIVHEYVEKQTPIPHYSPLTELFEISQLVCCKVMSIGESNSEDFNLILSLAPHDVQSEFHHKSIGKGSLLIGAIAGIEEHGYIIETGIRDMRAFMPIDNEMESPAIGQLLKCKVSKITHDNAASTATLSLVPQGKWKIKIWDDPSLPYLLPGICVQFTITEILKNGLRGCLFNETFEGYINEHQLGDVDVTPDHFEKGSTIKARILYTMPLTKFVYLSLHLGPIKTRKSSEIIPIGTIISSAEVTRIGTGGIVLKLNDISKGVINMKSIKSNFKTNFDIDDLMLKYQKGTKHKVRIINYDPIDFLYICSDDNKIINEKYYTMDDIEIGAKCQAKVERKHKNGYEVSVGKLKGHIENLHLSSSKRILKEGEVIEARVIWKNLEISRLYLTCKREYMSDNSKLLTNVDEVKIGKCYVGTVVKVFAKGYIVKFCNDIKGTLLKSNVKDGNIEQTLNEGQTMNFRIIKKIEKDDHIEFGLGLGEFNARPGDTVNGTICTKFESGLEIEFEHTRFKGIISVPNISETPVLSQIIFDNIHTENGVEAVCIDKNQYSLRDDFYLQKNSVPRWNEIEIGSVIRGYVQNVEDEVVELKCLISNYEKLIRVHVLMILENPKREVAVNFESEQVLHFQVLGKNDYTKTLVCSGKLSDVWDGNLNTTSSIFKRYYDDLQLARRCLLENENSLGKFRIGKTKVGKVLAIESGIYKIDLENGVVGLLKKRNIPKGIKISVGDEITAAIIWIDYKTTTIHLAVRDVKMYVPQHVMKTDNKTYKADILLVLDDVIVTALRKYSTLVFIPTKFHYNDVQPIIPIGVKEASIESVVLIKKTKMFNIGMFTRLFKKCRRTNIKVKQLKMLQLLDSIKQEDDSDESDSEVEIDEDELSTDDDELETEENTSEKRKVKADKTSKKKLKLEETEVDVKEESDTEEPTNELVVPDLSSFWSIPTVTAEKINEEVSSEEESDDDDNEESEPKKKKLSKAEKFKIERDEEAKIRDIEASYADPNSQPMNVDQFDRLVLAAPNVSVNWINYMVFHLQSTEIDKARAVARRALKSISFREETELFNIWIALLNLEVRYGTKESFTDTFKEANQRNEPFKVYSRTLQILAEAKKVSELQELMDSAMKKFKTNPELWPQLATACFEVGLREKPKYLMQRALANLPNKDRKLIKMINTEFCFYNLFTFRCEYNFTICINS